MADDKKRFHWLKLNEDFFDEDAMEWLEEQENGTAYTLFYLKLCLKAMNDEGVLIRRVGKMLIPYDQKKLSEMTRMPYDTVEAAIRKLVAIGLIEFQEDGAIYLPRVSSMVGSETLAAKRKRAQRLKAKQQPKLIEGQAEDNSGTSVGHCRTEIDIELDIDIEKEKDIEIDKDKKKKSTSGKVDDNKNKYNEQFELLWSLYPKGRKQGKESARKAFVKAIKDGVEFDDIKNGLLAYKKQIEIRKTETQFIKMGQTWFNGKCWEDEYEVEVQTKENEYGERLGIWV